MCLYLDKNYVLNTTEEDITVFKHLEINRNGTYRTTYQEFPVTIGETYSSMLITVEFCGWDFCSIGLHSFPELLSAKKDGAVACWENCAVAKCIIPKGSKYYVGTFGNEISYASDTIKYVKIVAKL